MTFLRRLSATFLALALLPAAARAVTARVESASGAPRVASD